MIGDFLGKSPANVVVDEVTLEGIPTGSQANLFGLGYFPNPVTLEPPERVLGSLP